MGMLKVDAVLHWSIPVNNLEDAENFYGEILGLDHGGRFATSRMSCFALGGHNILLCERKKPIVRTNQVRSRR
jgi:extradiol dioxygenase family protein